MADRVYAPGAFPTAQRPGTIRLIFTTRSKAIPKNRRHLDFAIEITRAEFRRWRRCPLA
jgi:hypothetical protein